ncbi:hypothetical protein SAMN05421812_11963 [Asanoa hainanensis]|uniref:Uncharacterized protein n=1 Tax=Asanoa hainanensis TaxID=560556 RepID=A0A239PD98_9ACTN|nr:DUF6114 domain-containing protein [Asanoa hainanensis]SNT64982.1 hypothetical protein SAMN05421812_11963 [Asanoa hainanensis]
MRGLSVARLGLARRRFRAWRESRPFWGGLFLVLSAAEIFLSTQLSLGGLSFQLGPTGFLSWLIPTVLLTCGVLTWTTPAQRLFYAVVGAVTAVFSLIGINLGGFFVGLLFGIVGAGLVFAWTPGTPSSPTATDPTAPPSSAAPNAEAPGPVVASPTARPSPVADAEAAPGPVVADPTAPPSSAAPDAEALGSVVAGPTARPSPVADAEAAPGPVVADPTAPPSSAAPDAEAPGPVVAGPIVRPVSGVADAEELGPVVVGPMAQIGAGADRSVTASLVDGVGGTLGPGAAAAGQRGPDDVSNARVVAENPPDPAADRSLSSGDPLATTPPRLRAPADGSDGLVAEWPREGIGETSAATRRNGGPQGYSVVVLLLVLGLSAVVAVRAGTPAYAAPCPKPTKTAPGQRTATPSPGAGAGQPTPEKPRRGILGDIIDGITGILGGGDDDSPDPGPDPSPRTSPKPAPSAVGGKPAPGDCAGASPGASAEPSAVVPLLGPDPSVPAVNSKPSLLTGTKLTMWGLRLEGIYVLHTAAGDVRSLKFSMSRSLVRTFALRVPQKAGAPLLIESDTLTVRGDVAFYTSRFVGRIAGIKLTLTPDSPLPPNGIPLTIPRIDFDDPRIDLMYVSCDELLAPTLNESFVSAST